MEAPPVRLAGTVLDRKQHICAFFNSDVEEYRALLPFAREGIEQGDRVVHLLDPTQREPRRARFQEAGIDVDAAERTGQLDLRPWQEAYLQDNCFDQDRMLALIESFLSSGRDLGFGRTRLWANMEWALEDCPGVEQLVEYESRLNHLLPQFGDPVCCTYDLARFDATVVMDILRTHPMVLVGGILAENPYYVEPEVMLQELAARKARKSPR
ncbi:MAG TPA: MEDS domain-containing protein [bacterium]|nr:MEDS domain-containing protein [bacterium]